MSRLYGELARVYHEMYQVIFDYEEELQQYDELLQRHCCHRILEVGCGSGHLARLLIGAGYDYTGLDLSPQMVGIAREELPEARFLVGDMRSLQMEERFPAVLVTGRTSTHLTTNQEVLQAFRCLRQVLEPAGILVLDAFEARAIFTDFQATMTQAAEVQGRRYTRISRCQPDLRTGWTWTWWATYRIEEHGSVQEVEDQMVLRAFTRGELTLLLELAGLRVEECRLDGPTLLVVARPAA